MKNQRGFAVPLIVILILAFIGGGYAYTKISQKEKSATPSDSSVVTAGGEAPAISDWKTYTNSQYGFQVNYPADWDVTPSVGNGAAVNTVFYFGPKGPYYENGRLSDAKWVINIFPYHKEQPGVRFTSGNREYYISDEGLQSEKFDLFLRSFKFTSPAASEDVPGWKTYRTDEFGFEVKYPADFIIDEGHAYGRIERQTLLGVAFKVPSRLSAGTNLSSDSYIAIERSNGDGDSCDAYSFLEQAQTAAARDSEWRKIGEASYSYGKSSGAGAGNYYEESVYARSITRSFCIIARLSVHSVNPDLLRESDPSIRLYDREQLDRLFRDVIASIRIIQAEDYPVIEKIVPAKGPVGITIDIIGQQFSGFEGDLDAWIENSKGEKAFLPSSEYLYPERYKEIYPGKELIRVRIEKQLCKANHSYSGKVCEEYLKIVPGMYKIYTVPWGKTSNKIDFEITQ
ncbi:MAG: hypothetical protein WC767_02335 [Candidatus Paceibacterota bacterium]|jgi:hypothetical protein